MVSVGAGKIPIRHVGNIALYLIIPLASAATPLLVIPSITSTGGAAAWASVAIAQSLGSAGALVCELGWGVTGPQEVAGAEVKDRRALYETSLSSRLLVFAMMILPVSVGTFLLSDIDTLSCIVVSVGSCALSLSPSWYFIGLGMPVRILFLESVPRLLIVASAAGGILITGDVLFYGLALIISVLFTLCATALSLNARLASPRHAVLSIRRQSTVGVGRVVGGLYTALPIAIVGACSPSAVAQFAAVERLMRMGSLVLVGFSNRLQGWIGSSAGDVRRHRIKQSIKIHILFGLVAGILFALLGPLVISILFTSTVHAGYVLTSLSGAVLFIICISRGFGLALVGVGRVRGITVAAVLAATVGAPAIALLSFVFGASGAILGEILAELTGLLLQFMSYIR